MKLLREHVSDVLRRECSLDRVQKNSESTGDLDLNLRKMAGDLGWISMCVPEELGGLGFGSRAACVMGEEAGRALAPESLTILLLAAPLLARHAPPLVRDRYLDRALAGELRVAVDTSIETPTVGLERVVLGAADAELVLFALPSPGGESVELGLIESAEGVSLRPAEAWDPTRRLSVATIEEAAIFHRLGEEAHRAAVRLMALLTAADSLGAWDAICRRTVDYLGVREQFGRKLGSFQALKHRLASLHADHHLKSALIEFASIEDAADPVLAQSWALLAKTEATNAAAFASEECLQLHGAIGFTWEHECHLFLKRTRLNQALVGDNDTLRAICGRHLTSILVEPAAHQDVLDAVR